MHEQTAQAPATDIAEAPNDGARQLAAHYTNALCERISNRYSLLVAKDIISSDGTVGVFIGEAERAAYASACRFLNKMFLATEG